MTASASPACNSRWVYLTFRQTITPAKDQGKSITHGYSFILKATYWYIIKREKIFNLINKSINRYNKLQCCLSVDNDDNENDETLLVGNFYQFPQTEYVNA